MVILDTNIIIDHLRQPFSRSQLGRMVDNHPKEILCLSVISIQELYEGKSTKKDSLEKDLLATISPLKILPYTYDVAQFAGKILRDLSDPIEFADAAIAATAVINGMELFTLNTKDFKNIEGLRLYKVPARS